MVAAAQFFVEAAISPEARARFRAHRLPLPVAAARPTDPGSIPDAAVAAGATAAASTAPAARATTPQRSRWAGLSAGVRSERSAPPSAPLFAGPVAQLAPGLSEQALQSEAPATVSAGASSQQAAGQIVVGKLTTLKVYNEDWAIGTIEGPKYSTTRVTGASLVNLDIGLDYEVRGKEVNHPKYGLTFVVEGVRPHLRADRDAIVKFMTRNYKGISATAAKKYLDGEANKVGAETDEQRDAFHEQIREILLQRPWDVDFTGYTRAKWSYKDAPPADDDGEGQADSIVSVELGFLTRDLALRLASIPGLREQVIKALAKAVLLSVKREDRAKASAQAAQTSGATKAFDPTILARCWEKLAQNPWRYIEEVEGYGFGVADALGRALRLPADSPDRLAALAAHAVREKCSGSGHIYLSRPQMLSAVRWVDPGVDAERVLELALKAGTLVTETVQGATAIYPPRALEIEKEIAARLHEILEPAEAITRRDRADVEARIQTTTKQVAPHMKDGLDPSQLEALANLVTSRTRIHTLTAGPGCGKTALMEVLSSLLKDRKMAFMAPTGKAAKVLHNRLSKCGRTATTIHSALGGSGSVDFQVNASDPLDADVVVLDETGMTDNDCFLGVLNALPPKAHLILLGDTQQLASVGPGNVLADLVAIEAVDRQRLTTTHRNSGGILEVVGQIGAGQLDCEDRPSVTFSHGLGRPEEMFGQVANEYIAAVREHGYDRVALVIPKRKGDAAAPGWNTTFANAALQQMCNGGAEKVSGTRFCVGDRIIIRANMSVPTQEGEDTRAVNGDTGTITGYNAATERGRAGVKELRLKLDDGRQILYPSAALESLQHAYALPVHAVQGSEYAHVIAVIEQANRGFYNRPMLFTGLSRPQKTLSVYGSDMILKNAASFTAPPRNSALRARLAELRGETLAEVADDGEGYADDDGPVLTSRPASSLRRFSAGEVVQQETGESEEPEAAATPTKSFTRFRYVGNP